MNHFIRSLVPNIKQCFSLKMARFHILAVSLTYLLVVSKIDWYYFTHVRDKSLLFFFSPAIGLGALLPILVPLVLIIYGHITRKKETLLLGWMFAQAALLGSLISSTYKAFTGRIQPNVHDVITDISSHFQFGFFRHGIFWGWPSSHTTIAFAMAVALIQFFPKNTFIRRAALIYAFYIGIGVSLSIHWFSDFVAGAIIGSVIGTVVGKSFNSKKSI